MSSIPSSRLVHNSFTTCPEGKGLCVWLCVSGRGTFACMHVCMCNKGMKESKDEWLEL